MNHSNMVVGLSTLHVGVGYRGAVPMVARVSLVDYQGAILHDIYVQPVTEVQDYRTIATGITPELLTAANGALPFPQAQQIIGGAVRGRVIVGHALYDSFSILGFVHPESDTRDLALYLPLRKILGVTKPPTLATLVYHFMAFHNRWNLDDSVENARTAVELYRSVEKEWEDVEDKDMSPCALPPEQFQKNYS